MASVTRVAEAAEAVCGALHDLGWEFIGESDFKASTWFLRGDGAKLVKIEVQRSRLADFVIVNVLWPVLANPPYEGRQTLQIDVAGGTVAEVKDATERAVVRCLEIFRDVLAQTGVAAVPR